MSSSIEPKCLVCESSRLEPLVKFYSRYVKGFFHQTAICQDCGHVQVSPLFGTKEYQKINDQFFGAKYMVKGKLNTANNKNKLERIDKFLTPYSKKGANILDVGGGEGWNIDFFKDKGCNYFSIEPIERLAKLILERGGEVIGESIYTDYPKHEGTFDILIFRHVLEHMMRPKDALIHLKRLLAPNGILYLVLPNGTEPYNNKGFDKTGMRKKGFKTSYLRPVHLSYFDIRNVLRLANDVGLRPVTIEKPDELIVLLTHGADPEFKAENIYLEVKEVFLKTQKENLPSDFKHIVFDLPKAIVKRLLN